MNRQTEKKQAGRKTGYKRALINGQENEHTGIQINWQTDTFIVNILNGIADKIKKLRSVKMVDWTVKQTDGKMDRRINRPIDKWTDRQTCLLFIFWMTIADKIKKLKSVKMVDWTVNQTDGRMDSRLTNELTDRLVYH
jgi:hypothetical protein